MKCGRIIIFILICMITGLMTTGCSHNLDFFSIFSSLTKEIEKVFDEVAAQSDNQDIEDSELIDNETMFLGDQIIGGIDLADGEVGYIG